MILTFAVQRKRWKSGKSQYFILARKLLFLIKSFLFKEQNEGRKKGKAYSWLYFYDFEQQNLHFYC